MKTKQTGKSEAGTNKSGNRAAAKKAVKTAVAKPAAHKTAKLKGPNNPHGVPAPGNETAAPSAGPRSGTITTGVGHSGVGISAEDPRQKKAERDQPIGLRPTAHNESTASRAKGKSGHSLLYRGLEILRTMTGHTKSPEYLELEKDLGFGG